MENIDQLQETFDSFYLIKHPIKLNIIRCNDDQIDQDYDRFLSEMPYAFKIASDLSDVESQALKSLRALGEKAKDLVEYLNHQSRKIDLMMSYILLNQDEPQYQTFAVKFGGGGFITESKESVRPGEQFIVKIFLETEAAAVYCQATALGVVSKDDLYEISFVYTHIREQDQELLVRASLHLQTTQLKKNKEKKASSN